MAQKLYCSLGKVCCDICVLHIYNGKISWQYFFVTKNGPLENLPPYKTLCLLHGRAYLSSSLWMTS